ncbi:hypothetical protein [Phascolarctobacterium sp.]|uniref:hypothetical protein n=1 Tax=Phascolarctobacterium sp. TaxID=2049039 RepID=UPI003869FBD9
MGIVITDDSSETRIALQRLCREQLKRKLLADILADITVCKMEGWDWRAYPQEIRDMMNDILGGNQNG